MQAADLAGMAGMQGQSGVKTFFLDHAWGQVLGALSLQQSNTKNYSNVQASAAGTTRTRRCSLGSLGVLHCLLTALASWSSPLDT